MVRFMPLYDLIVQRIRASDSYQNATEKERQEINQWLNRDDVKEYFSAKLVPQLTFHESFLLEIANSIAFREIKPEEREKIMGYLNSKNSKGFLDSLEKKISNSDSPLYIILQFKS